MPNGTTATGKVYVAMNLQLVETKALSTGSTAGITLNLIATMKTPPVSTTSATITVLDARTHSGIHATGTASAMKTAAPRTSTPSMSGSNATKRATQNVEKTTPLTTTATGQTKVARIHTGTTASGTMKAATR